MAKGIGDLVFIAPLRGTVGGAFGAGCITLPKNGILVAGLIILVANVNALRLERHKFRHFGSLFCRGNRAAQVAVNLRVDFLIVQISRRIAVGVDHGGSRQRVDCVGIGEMAGGIGLARKDAGHADSAHISHRTDKQTGVYVVVIEPMDFHRSACIENHNDFLDSSSLFFIPQHGEQVFLSCAEGQGTAPVSDRVADRHAPEEGLHIGVAEEGEPVLLRVKGQRVILIIQEHGALFHFIDVLLKGGLNKLRVIFGCKIAKFTLVVGGVYILRAAALHSHNCRRIQRNIDRSGIHIGKGRGYADKDQQKCHQC